MLTLSASGRTLLFGIACLVLHSCSVFQPNVMLRTKRNFNYTPSPETPVLEYRIAPNDIIEFEIYTNDGFKRIDITSAGDLNRQQGMQSGLDYLVEFDGLVKFPILGRIPVSGLTLRECEKMLEGKYAEFYNKPFVLLKIMNRRVIVFPGSEGSAKVLKLENENTTVLEALALAGGISSRGKARRIKLIRGNTQNPEVYLINLATINGMKQGDMILQANDIIYVEPTLKVSQTLLSEITPVIGLITSLIFIYSVVSKP